MMVAARQETAPGAAAGAGDEVAAQIGRLQDELNAIKQTVAGFGRASGGACNCAACADAAHQLAQHARQDVQAAIADLEALARRNPRYLIGGALGVGLVVGLLLGRR
jgi:ElaB/YqjD/DUF883 family membrane-anchored ribosome-binding protein